MKKILILLLVLSVLGGGYWFFLLRKEPVEPTSSTDKNQNNQQVTGFDTAKFSLTDPTSIWVIVNKKNGLPDGYKPNDLVVPDVRLRLGASAEQMQLRKVTAEALKTMIDAAKKDGVDLMLGSGYRSEALQKSFYDGYVAKDGLAAADTYSARPGHSEHQTGLALDVDRADQKCHLEECFGDLPEGKWLAANAHKYGFVLRYHKNKQEITGYIYEPWHFRYVGVELAAEVYKSGQTLEEFFNLPPANNY